MKRAIKILAAVVAVAVALILLAALILPWVVDPNDYRDDLERLVQERTGRELQIEGRMELSVFPWLGAEIGRITLGNAPGFGPEPFARVASADVRVRLLPLLWGEVAVGTVVLNGPEVHLARDENGRVNWADLVAPPRTDGEPAPSAGKEAMARGEGGGALAALTVNGLEVRDGRASWADAQAGTRYTVSGLELTSGAVRSGEPFPVTLALGVASQQPQLQGRLRLEGEATVQSGAERYELTGMQMTARLEGEGLPDGRLEASLGADVTVDGPAGTAAVRGLELRALGGELQGEMAARRFKATPALDGEFRLTTVDRKRLAGVLRDLLPALRWQPEALADASVEARIRGDLGPDGVRLEGLKATLLGLRLEGEAGVRRPRAGAVLHADLQGEVSRGTRLLSPLTGALPADLRPDALDGARLGVRGTLDSRAGTLEVPELRLAALGATVRGEAAARDLNREPMVSGKLVAEPFSPRALLERSGLAIPETADPQTLKEASLETAFELTPDGGRLRDLRLTLDDSRLTGSAGVPALAGPQVRFDLALNEMDLDRYLPPPAAGEEATPPPTPGEAAGAGASQLPMELLRRLDVAGQLDVGRLKVNNLRLSQLAMKVDGRDGRFRIHPLSARLYGGRYQGDIRLDARGKELQVSGDERLAGVGTGPLLKDLMGRAYVTGTADVQADLSFRGSETDTILRSLTGRGSYVLRDGSIRNLDLERALTAAYAALGKGPPGGGEGEKTPFRELKGTASVEEGRIRSRDLSLRSDLMDVAGQGVLDLPRARMDYRLEAVIGDKAGGGLAELQGLAIPIQVVGSVQDPAVKVDLAGALKERARKALQGESEGAKDKARESLEEKKKELEEKAREILGF